MAGFDFSLHAIIECESIAVLKLWTQVSYGVGGFIRLAEPFKVHARGNAAAQLDQLRIRCTRHTELVTQHHALLKEIEKVCSQSTALCRRLALNKSADPHNGGANNDWQKRLGAFVGRSQAPERQRRRFSSEAPVPAPLEHRRSDLQ